MRVLTLTTPDTENGLGLRVTLWVAGCSHQCSGCHNKHTWNYNQGLDISNPDNFNTVKNKIFEELDKPYIEGLTLSGGDPLDQDKKSLAQLYYLLIQINHKYPNKNIWVYSGDIFENLVKNPDIKDVLEECTILIDGPFKKELYDPDIAFRGSSNQRIIDLKRSFAENQVVEITID